MTGPGSRKAQSSSPFGAPPANTSSNTPSNDRARDPRRKRDAVSGIKKIVKDSNQDYMSRFEQTLTLRQSQLKRERTKQRTKAIDEGLMANPDQPTSLNRAITPTGTCMEMCPEYERVERIVQKMVDKSEKVLNPSTGELEVTEGRMIKRFRRSAAGYDEQLPSDIRTPSALLQTLNYITRYVISDDEALGAIHKFVWDRTRSIRNDLSIQQLTQQQDVEIAVKCLERIARFHIISLHLLSNPANKEQFDHHQEREQLNNTLLSLLYYYDDNRGRMRFLNEDEFRAYYILFSIHDQRPDLEARVQNWPRELRQSPRIRVAIELFAAAGNTWEYQGTLDSRRPNAIAQGFYSRFFNLVRSNSVSYLMACIAEIYFNQIRQTAIRSIWKAYCRQPLSQQHKNQEWTVDQLTTTLCFDDEDQTIKFCEDQNLELKTDPEGQLYLDWGSRSLDSVGAYSRKARPFQPSSQQVFSVYLVESKRYGRTLPAIILGMSVSQALRHGMIDRILLDTGSEPVTSADDARESQESLFVSDDEEEKEIEKVHVEPPDAGMEKETPSAFTSIFSRPLNGGDSQDSTNPFLKHLWSSLPPSQPSSTLSASAPAFVPQGFANSGKDQPSPTAASATPPAVPFSTQTTLGPSVPTFSTTFGSNVGTAFAPSFPAENDTRTSRPTPYPPSQPSFGAPSALSPMSFGKPSSAQAVGVTEDQKKPLFPSFSNTPTTSTMITPTFEFDKTTGTEEGPKKPLFTPLPSALASFSAPGLGASGSSSNIANIGEPQKPPFPSFSETAFGQRPDDSAKSTAFKSIESPDKENPFLLQNTAAPSTSVFAPPQLSNAASTLKAAKEIQPSPFPPSGTLSTPSSTPFPTISQFPGPQTQDQKSFEKKVAPKPKFPEIPPSEQPAIQGKGLEAPKSPTLKDTEKPPEGFEQQTLKEREKRRLEEEEAAKKAAAKREFERLQAVQREKQRKEAAEREAARRERAMKEQEEEIRAAKQEIERREAAEQKAVEKEFARKEAIEKEVAKRKALYEENEEEVLSQGKSKMARLSPEQSLTAEELLARELSKQKATPPKPRTEQKSLINEDELLFSAARMAGRELSRINLFDGLPRLRESVSRPSTPSSPLSSSVLEQAKKRNRSASIDGLHTTVNGYEVALAPPTPLGLGRTLSRTEQRIRQTGAKGLAYKPIASILKTPGGQRKQKTSKLNKSLS
ncbi:actin cytoskeleton and mitosis protein [Emydomyces testavorans]|uniref:Actin cytoskeleton and mitosis protein n=1 Tax=Emydomyces testavorans TaxID=2070801 RepID=A0AAF0IHA8_9EURO|nr:actin cytoskeleton and mitosis protein [Emydomyces testavorans]